MNLARDSILDTKDKEAQMGDRKEEKKRFSGSMAFGVNSGKNYRGGGGRKRGNHRWPHGVGKKGSGGSWLSTLQPSKERSTREERPSRRCREKIAS